MKKAFIILFAALALSISLVMPGMVNAQGTASVVDTTVPVPPVIRSAVDAWLAVSPPVAVPYYAINYVHDRGTDTFVSLAALNIANITDAWHVTDSTVAWFGSVIVHSDQSVTMFSERPPFTGQIKVFAIPSFAPGGGSDVRFPWQISEKMMYGVDGLHAAGGGGAYATGFDAVDFLGGRDLGSGVAHDMVYAAFDGTVDYVCADAITTLIRTVDETSGNRFIYAHLLDNATLVEDHVFIKGAGIGFLKHGSFDDNCGYAEQQEEHYHLHFGFEAANDAFRMSDCILNVNTEDWKCGTKTVAPGEYLLNTGSGGAGTGGDPGGNPSVSDPSFWDMATTGFVSIWSDLIVQKMPEHQAMQLTYVIYSTAKLMLRIAYVMVYSNINLGHLVTAIIIGLGTKIVFGIAEFIVFLFKAWKSLVPIIGA